MKINRFISAAVVMGSVVLCGTYGALAQQLPGGADAGRITPSIPSLRDIDKAKSPPVTIPKSANVVDIPEEIKSIMIDLESINIEGVSAFDIEEFASFYREDVGKNVSLARVWEIAASITRYYRDAGYFLSRAYVPEQEIVDGNVIINVIEGYVGTVVVDSEIAANPIIGRVIDRVNKDRPLSIDRLERHMLQLNDIPGKPFVAFLRPWEEGPDGAVELVLSNKDDDYNKGNVTIDNYGSRFLGPYRATLSYQYAPALNHGVSLAISSDLRFDEMQYVSSLYRTKLHPDLMFEGGVNYVSTSPGSLLEANDIESDAWEVGVGLRYQVIRQWQKNLSIYGKFNLREIDSTVLGNVDLTQDSLRVLRLGASYDQVDSLNGYNFIDVSVSQGLDIGNASDRGDNNISRAEAVASFTKLNMSYVRHQRLPKRFVMVGQVSGQYASDPLLSPEEFGYGGISQGRAYDPSEITGDHGISAAIELQYLGLEPWKTLGVKPYVFYDIGKVWNEDTGGGHMSASSVGLGSRVSHEKSGLSMNLGLAWPLTKSVDTPLYGNGKNPRAMFELGYDF